ncbi:response regulator [Bacillus sp. FJAT-50079]|uniref:response regulator transcription factor n=1 Tax=Bacillus sp. FJAT-50079 TaxID=2833577 RepID=UPI001BC97665|nr:response regulator [Bacillus sp. FJAT-50079]MBS4208859.1 response regulator [Bacillus sp. FJAT-50079]
MRILLIEDEPMIRKGIRKLLMQTDVEDFHIHKLVEAENAEEADQLLQTEVFDLIFTDIEMGDKNGLELMEKWREEREDTQWVIISGYDHFEYAQKAIRYGVKEYLLKPVAKIKIKETIERCLEMRKNQSGNDFVEAKNLEDFLNEVEEAIWSIDNQQLHVHFRSWKSNIEHKNFLITYYNDVLSYVLDTLFVRLNKRGSKIVQASSGQINGKTVEQSNDLFMQRCEKIIELIAERRKGNEIDPIEAAKQYILDHLDKEISLDEVANRLGLNASYFSQLFKKETGETFVKYRIRLRMDMAKELLLKNDIRIIDIPSMIGLNDHPHFTKTFKKYTGQTPTEFRNKMGIG